MSDAVLIQQASGESRLQLELSSPRHADYCARHGMTYWPVFGDVQRARPPHWNKVPLIQQALRLGFETVAWLDADTLIVRDDEDLRTALNGGGPLALAHHPGNDWSRTPPHWNCGVMIIRNEPRTRAFFDALWETGPIQHRIWKDQASLLHLLPQFPDLVQRLDDRWNATHEITAVPRPVIKAWHGLGRTAITAMYDELRQLGGVDARVAAVAGRFVHTDNLAERTAQCLARLPAYPRTLAGRGIVMGGGGLGYFSCAWVCIQQLRRLGCTLPIQLWHLGPTEMDERMRALVAPLGVECVDGREVQKRHPARILEGWELKPYSILHCPFREVLLLDADNVPVQNPEFLFDTPAYRETGAIFWPDCGRMDANHAAWGIFGVPFRDEPEFESGQIVVNKEQCWRALSLALWFNENSDFFYYHVHGDKDTYRFAWHRLGQKFSMPSFPLTRIPGTFCQHDFEGRRLFQHRNTDKWNFCRGNQPVPGFLYEQECLQDLARLRKIWDGLVNK